MNAFIIADFRSAVGKAPCLRQAGKRARIPFHATKNQ